MNISSITTIEQYYSEKSLIYKDKSIEFNNKKKYWKTSMIQPKNEHTYISLKKSFRNDFVYNLIIKNGVVNVNLNTLVKF